MYTILKENDIISSVFTKGVKRNKENTKGWLMSHFDVSAVRLYLYAISKNADQQSLNKLTTYVQKKIENKEFYSFWWTDFVYTLYYLDNSELELGDTNYLTIYVAHLKAGNTSSDVSERARATESIMDYHSINYKSNHSYIISGDFNTYTSNEQGFINLVGDPNTSIRFKDPIKKSGSWNNNSSFASIHTQSTRVSSSCHSGGGLDDRFDFVLCGQEIISNERGYGYVSGSYEALGNDGRHFNANLNSGSNSSVPVDVLDALYRMSDHLPVSMQLKVNRTTAHSANLVKDNYLIMNNPVRDLLTWRMQLPMTGYLSILDIHGKCVVQEKIEPTNYWNYINLSTISKGLYTITVSSEDHQIIRKKLVKL